MKSKLNVRSKPSKKNSRIIDSLNSGARVTVTDKKENGWSKIKYKNNKGKTIEGFVAKKYLRYSYKWDKSKIYTYKDNGVIFKVEYVKNNSGWDEWKELNNSRRVIFTLENKNMVLLKPDLII